MAINKNYYSSVAEVKIFSGVKFSDLRFATDADFDAQVEKWLYYVRDLINKNRRMDFAAQNTYNLNGTVLVDNVPSGIHSIALRAVSNLIRNAVQSQTTPIVVINDNFVKFIDVPTLSKSLLDELNDYPRGLPAPYNKYMTTPHTY